jgi:hypothetical protein
MFIKVSKIPESLDKTNVAISVKAVSTNCAKKALLTQCNAF